MSDILFIIVSLNRVLNETQMVESLIVCIVAAEREREYHMERFLIDDDN